eukprot:jgi/Tetstr1/426926/TSEL_017139.t1
MCLRCGAQPRMVTSKGKRRRYCSRCEADMSRECRKRRKLRNLAASAPPSHFESLFLLAETCELVGAEAWEEQQTPSEETLTASWRQKTPSEETLTSMPPREDGEGEAGEEGRGESSARNAATASLSSVPPTEIAAGACVGGGDLADCATSHQKVALDASQGPVFEEMMRTPDDNMRNAETASLTQPSVPPTEIAGACVGGDDLVDCATSHQKVALDASQGPASEERMRTPDENVRNAAAASLSSVPPTEIAGACVGGGDLADCATSHQNVARDASQGPTSKEMMRTPDENVRNAAAASLSAVPPTEIAGACVGGGDLADCATSHQKVARDASQGPTSEERIGTRDWCGIEVQLARLRADTAVLFIELGALMELTDQPCKKRKAAV